MHSKQKSFADDGWAVWIDGDDTSTVYLNDWLNPRGASFIDFAVRICGILESSLLSVYIPFSVKKEDLTDISLRLKDEEIFRATFSAAGIIDFQKNACTSEAAYHGKTIDIIHISQTGFQMKPLSDGTLLTVDLKAVRPYLANDEGYFLFRLPHRSLDEVFQSHIDVPGLLERLRDRITTPVIAEKYGYSVRINESRLLPAEINRIGAFHRQKLKKAVVTISVNENYEVSDHNCYRIRRLEEKLYKNYVPDGFSCEDVITYQWNQSRETDLLGHFNFYFSMEHNSISRASMLLYVILLLMVGTSGGAMWDLIKLIFK